MAKIILGQEDPKAMKIRIEKFEGYLVKAMAGKLVGNKEICGFFMIPPRNKSKLTTILFNGKVTGYAGDGFIEVLEYKPSIFMGDTKFKYDVFCELRDKLSPIVNEDEEEPIEEPKETKKKPVKRKSRKKKGA